MLEISDVSNGSICLLLGVAGLLIWMLNSPNPVDARISRINQAIESGDLGVTHPVVERRLNVQLPWLLNSAKMDPTYTLNEAISKSTLNFLITDASETSIELTRNGKGNAMYDAELRTVFIDHSLLWPTEFETLVGDIEGLGFILSYSNFVIAHELGHIKAKDSSAGFFSFAQLTSEDDIEAEYSADRFAVKTILEGRIPDNLPPLLAEFNATDLVGLDTADLSDLEYAVADILGSIDGLTKTLLYTSIPYSPFFSDATHPTFVERTREALKTVAGEDVLSTVQSHTSLLFESHERYNEVATLPKHTITLPGMVRLVATREDRIWIGMESLPGNGCDLFVYSALRNALEPLQDDYQARKAFVEIARNSVNCEEESDDEILPDDASWLATNISQHMNKAFSGDVSPLDSDCSLMIKVAGITGSQSICKSSDREIIEHNTESLQLCVSQLLNRESFSISKIQLREGGYEALVVTDSEELTQHLMLVEINGTKTPWQCQIVTSLVMNEHIHLAVESARVQTDEWKIIGLDNADPYESVVLYLFNGVDLNVQSRVRTLTSYLGDDANGTFQRDTDLSVGEIRLLASDSLAYWYREDSIYLLDDRNSQIVFHPAIDAEVTRWDDKTFAIWTDSGSKLYIYDQRIQGIKTP